MTPITDETLIELHRSSNRARLRRRFGVKHHKRRIRHASCLVRSLVGGGSAYEALLSTPDDDGYPIGDNISFVAAFDAVIWAPNADPIFTTKTWAFSDKPHILAKLTKTLKGQPTILTAINTAIEHKYKGTKVTIPISWLRGR